MSKNNRGGWMVRAAAVLAVFLAFDIFPGFAARPSQDIPRPGGTLHVRTFSDTLKPNLDPALGSWVFITEQIFGGLVRLDNDLNPVPDLAEYWRLEDDGKTSVFYLRKGVKFHNGRELTSDDVKFSLERLLQPEVHSPFYEYFAAKVVGALDYREGRAADVAGFKTPDKYVFEIRWRNPYVSALYLLGMSFCKILPKSLVQGQEKDFFWKPVGTGPFRFESWLRSPRLDIVGVRLEKNNAYFGNKANLAFLEVSPYYTVDHFMNKEIEIVPFLSGRIARSGCQVIDGGLQNMTFLLMSCHIPPLDRPSIRQALASGIDKEKLADAVRRDESNRRATNNFVPAKWPGFFPRDDASSFNFDKARQTLDEQGFFMEKKFPELILYLPWPRDPENLEFARELENQLETLRITLTVKYYRTIAEVKSSTQPYLVKVDWAIDVPDPENIIMPLFQSRSEINLRNLHYANSRLDKLLDEAGVERSLNRRTELFRQMEQILESDLPAVPLYSSEPRIALQPYVRGVRVPALGFQYLDVREIWLDQRGPRP